MSSNDSQLPERYVPKYISLEERLDVTRKTGDLFLLLQKPLEQRTNSSDSSSHNALSLFSAGSENAALVPCVSRLESTALAACALENSYPVAGEDPALRFSIQDEPDFYKCVEIGKKYSFTEYGLPFSSFEIPSEDGNVTRGLVRSALPHHLYPYITDLSAEKQDIFFSSEHFKIHSEAVSLSEILIDKFRRLITDNIKQDPKKHPYEPYISSQERIAGFIKKYDPSVYSIFGEKEWERSDYRNGENKFRRIPTRDLWSKEHWVYGRYTYRMSSQPPFMDSYFLYPSTNGGELLFYLQPYSQALTKNVPITALSVKIGYNFLLDTNTLNAIFGVFTDFSQIKGDTILQKYLQTITSPSEREFLRESDPRGFVKNCFYPNLTIQLKQVTFLDNGEINIETAPNVQPLLIGKQTDEDFRASFDPNGVSELLYQKYANNLPSLLEACQRQRRETQEQKEHLISAFISSRF